MEIAIVTDSTCDIPRELAKQNHIHIVPNIIVIENESIEDGKGFSRQEFYTRLPEMIPLPTTSTASSGSYHALYEKLFNQGANHIISIHAASLLSGIFNAANIAAQDFGERVHVIDSQQVTLGLGFQVLSAAEAVIESFPLEVVLTKIEDVRRRVRVTAMLDTLEYVRRSGRISWARASLSSLLRIKPFVEVKDGVIHRSGEVRTRRKGVARLREILHGLGPLERLAILHTNAEEDARQFLESLDTHPSSESLIVNITTVIGTHVGPNGLGFATVIK